MADTQDRSDISMTIPAAGRAILTDLMHSTVWDSTTLQYYLGDENTFDLEDDFRTLFEGGANDYGEEGGLPDANYAYEAQTVRAFSLIDSVIGTDFSRITTAAQAATDADIIAITSDDFEEAGLEGFFTQPGGLMRGTDDSWVFGAMNGSLDVMQVAPERGGGEYLNWTLIHEIGHGLGLEHPFDNNEVTWPSIGSDMDNERYTVMSYTGATNANAYGHAVSLMALDIATLQAQYGTESYATGNSTYTLYGAREADLQLNEGDVHIGRAYFSIWDSGGTDTIDYGGMNNAVMINLMDATLDNAAIATDVAQVLNAFSTTSRATDLNATLRSELLNEDFHAGGFFSRVLTEADGTYSGIDGGFTIANGAVIENATGGDQDDILLGNEANNTLTGNDGEDVLVGGAGNDTLDGGEDCDTAAFSGARADYEITDNEDGTVTITHSNGGADGVDLLRGIELAQFSDERVALGEEGALEFTEVTSNAFLAPGENVLRRNDDSNSGRIDITSIFEDGLIIDGDTYTEFYVNTNGNVTFGSGLGTYTPTVIGGGSNERLIAPYWADVDTRNPRDDDGNEIENPGEVTWGFNEERDSIVVTWNNVGYFNRQIDLLSSFQLEIMDRGCNNIEIIFRYGDITWTAGDASQGEGGLGGVTSRAGFHLGDTLYELPTSGNEPAMLNLESFAGNLGVAGVWQFIVSGGEVQGVGTDEADVFEGTEGNDNFIGDLGNDLLDGGLGEDTLLGGPGDDTVRGGEGNDSLVGGDGTDRVNGGPGDDTLNGGDTDADLRDEFFGGEGNDLIDAGFGNDEINGGAGDDTILGGFGVDTIAGGDGNDVITGQAFSDLIFGNDGDDFVNGGFGSDRVNGGDGADRFFHLGVLDHGNDWIQDYDSTEGDVLVYGGNARIDQFQINTAETQNAGQVGVSESFVIYRPSGQILWALVDGDAQEEINLVLGGQTYDLLA